MTRLDTATRLRWHAGLVNPVGFGASLSDALASSPFDRDMFETAADDLVSTLSLLNHELNGPTPSADIGPPADIPREVAYAVAEVQGVLADNVGLDPSVAGIAWSVATAWRAVLAGDIDDLDTHLVEERNVGG